MALWASSGISTTESAMVFNQILNKKAVSMARKKNGLLYAVLSKKEIGATPGVSGFNRHSKVTGKNVELRLKGRLRTPNYVANGSAELGASDPASAFQTDVWGGAEFALSHIYDVYGIPGSQLDRYAGDEAKTLSFMDDIATDILEGYEDLIGTAVNADQAQANITVGGWPFAIETDNTYGTIDRTDNANADFRGNVTTSTGTLTLAKIRNAQNEAIVDGGMPKVGISGTTVYGTVQGLVEAYSQVVYDGSEWSDFGGVHFSYGGIKFVLDQRAPSGELGLLDPTSWHFYESTNGMTTKGIMVDPSKKAAYVLPWTAWVGFICEAPSHNARLVGIS